MYKSLYVGLSWSCATCVIPQLISHTDLDLSNIVIVTLLSTSFSNLADIQDIEEDKKNRIATIPVKYGRRNAVLFSVYTGLSSVPFIIKNHQNSIRKNILYQQI